MEPNIFSSALLHAIANAHKLQSNVGDWSEAIECFKRERKNNHWIQAHDTTPSGVAAIKAQVTTYDEYHQTPWGATFVNLVGQGLSAGLSSIDILDVGSGRSSTFKNLMSGHQSRGRYMSIDKGVSVKESKSLFGCGVLDSFQKSHLQADVFKLPLDWTDECRMLGMPGFEKCKVVILDIEPHGRELDVYDAIVDALDEVHIIVLKCVGSMDTMGMGFADYFLSSMLDRKRLVDYFGVSESNLTRDVFVIATRHDYIVRDGDGHSIRDRVGKGGRYGVYYEDSSQRPMVCVPSAKVVDELMFGP